MKRRDEVLVGVLLTVALVVGIVGTIWLVRGGLSSGYPLYARFPWGAGLSQGQPVLLAGVDVGYVAKIDLVQDGTLGVELRISDDYQVPEGSTAAVVPVGYFGDQSIALTPKGRGRGGSGGPFYDAGDTVPLGPSGPSIPQLLARVDTIGRSVGAVTDALQLELVQNGGIADLRKTLAATNRLIAQLNAVAVEQSRELTLTQAQLRRTVAALDSAALDSTVRNVRTSTANVAALTDSLRTTTSLLNGTLAKLTDGSGTAGKLLTDTLLYRDVRSLVTRLDSLTLDFKKNPRRYINLEIF